MPGVATVGGALAPGWEARLEGQIVGLSWSPDGARLAVASIEGPLAIFSAADGALLHHLPGHAGGTLALAWSPAGRPLASAGQNGQVRLWDPETGAELAALAGGAPWVEHLAWSKDGSLLASAAGREVRVWETSGALRRAFPDHASTVSALAWRPAGTELSSACYGGVQLFRVGQATPVRTYAWKGSILCLAWSPTGAHVATGNQDQSVHLWQAATGRDLQMTGYAVKVRELAWVAGGQLLATGGGVEVTLWDMRGRGPAGSTPLVLAGHGDLLTGLAAQRDGSLLASAGRDGQVIQWSPLTGREPLARGGQEEGLVALAWSPDDRLLATGGAGGMIAVWPAVPAPRPGGRLAASPSRTRRR
jgi:WD40 repeat protein